MIIKQFHCKLFFFSDSWRQKKLINFFFFLVKSFVQGVIILKHLILAFKLKLGSKFLFKL